VSVQASTSSVAGPAGVVYRLPVILCGRQIEAAERWHSFEYLDGVYVQLPQAPPEAADQILATPASALRDLSVDDLTIFFAEVGRRWSEATNRWRRLALELGPHVTGYHDSMIRTDVEYLARALNRAKQYDFIATDLGDPYLLDEWRPFHAVHQRCWPKGLIVHIMVGNVPVAGLFAFYRSLITKNVTVAKLPSRDVVSALCFANCIVETDPEHPAARALTALYWEPESDLETEILERADVVSAWGRGETIEAVRRHVGAGKELIEFGPKRSFSLVLRGESDMSALSRRLAWDVVNYDQEACFSCHEVYCEADVGELADALADALDRYEQVIPRRSLTIDQEAHVQRARIEAMALGWEVRQSLETEWTVVTTDQPQPLCEHPLGRFVYIHPIADRDEVLRFVDANVQTVMVAPWSESAAVRDMLTAAGADRVVPPGRMSRFRPGLSHDGFFPMARMVRWVSAERDATFKYEFASEESAMAEAQRYAVIDDVTVR
jgi:long-chain-fatty-acyl-CoA reductase